MRPLPLRIISTLPNHALPSNRVIKRGWLGNPGAQQVCFAGEIHPLA